MEFSTRPPYVSFERRAVEDRAASLQTGCYRTREVDFIIIVPHGAAGHTKLEYEYESWLARVKAQSGGIAGPDGLSVQSSRFPLEWIEKIQAQYELWRKGQSLELDGTPVRNWPVLSPGQVQTCIDMHILTVEELAQASDEAIARMGMGWVALRERARDWVRMSKSPEAKVGAELELLRAEVRAKEARIQMLERELAALKAREDAANRDRQSRLQEAGAS